MLFFKNTSLKIVLLSIFIVLPTLAAQAFPLTPDIEMTPGHLCSTTDSDFKEFRYHERIPYCKRKVSTFRKNTIYDLYGIPEHCRHRYTIDHLIPLALGGSNANENLWPEHVHVKATRPALEIQLYWELRKGNITQDDAVEIILFEKNQVSQVFKSHDFKASCDIPTLH